MSLDVAYQTALPSTNDYDVQCTVSCDASVEGCPGPCDSYDTPWISSQQGGSDQACAAFQL